jgi:hypothetical protein
MPTPSASNVKNTIADDTLFDRDLVVNGAYLH